MKVFLVDDEPKANRLLESYLAEFSEIESITAFTNPREALQAIQRDNPDLIFLDISMPEMDGISFAAEVLEFEHNPEIVFVTAYNKYAIDAFEVNAMDYMLKPIEKERLQRAFGRYVKKIEFKKGIRDDQKVLTEPIEMRLFGDFQLRCGHVQVQWNMEKAQELFVYLYLNRSVKSVQIIEEFFSEFNYDAGKQYMHTCIYQIRKSIKEAGLQKHIEIKHVQKAYNLVVSNMNCDEHDFKNAVQESLEKGSYRSYLKVCEIYQGTFMASMNSPWILKYRLDYEKQYYQVVEKLSEFLLADKQFEAALPYAELLVEHEPMFPKYVNFYINGLIGIGDDFKAKQVLHEFRLKWTKELKRDLPDELLEVAQWLGMQ